MQTLEELLSTRPEFDLDGLVEVANQLLPGLLPTDARFRPDVNPRLVRHYTTQGLLEAPLRTGREARYTVDHLLQLLALRRLIAEGLQAGSIGTLLVERDREGLLAIIEGRASVQAKAGTDARTRALSRIEAIRGRMAGSPSPSKLGAATASMRGSPLPSGPEDVSAVGGTPFSDTWERFNLLDGVELHVRGDVAVPTSPDEQQRLLNEITRLLILIAQRRLS